MLEKINEFFHKDKTQDENSQNEIRELSGTQVAILATDGFEESELTFPKKALENAGAQVHIVSLESGKIKSFSDGKWGKSINVDMTVVDAFAYDFDFLVLPGGVINPDKLRNDPTAVAFVETFVKNHKPIAAICHGPQTLLETDFLSGKIMTSWPSLKTDILNAGAEWVDEEVVVDGKLITSRKPEDLTAFNQKMIEEFKKHHAGSNLPSTEGYVVTL